MTTRSSLLVALIVAATSGSAQLNMSLLGHLDYQALHVNTHLSNLWGYTDELGNEYAIVGVNGVPGSLPPSPGGVSIVDVTDPANPVEVFWDPGPINNWREIKTWGDYAYVTTEANYGLQIIDLSPLPSSTTLPTVLFQGAGWETAHSLFIDENGRLYVHGTNRGNGGVIMYDLTADPMNPVEVGEFDTWYCHDSFARGDTLYAAHIYDGFFSIVDVSDPADPVLLGTQSTPSNFTHNMWLDASGDHLFTTDEVNAAFVASYDVSDPGDIQYLDQLQSDPGSGTIPHNTYWLNDFLVTSYYSFGAVIYDVSEPGNMVEVGNYDTSPLTGGGFIGAWGVHPFLPSGNLIISDIEGGLYILAPTYVHACWLEGTVTDAITTAPVNNAIVTIVGPLVTDNTALDGTYQSGYHAAGTYDVHFQAAGYEALTATGVVLQNGVTTIVDAALTPLVPFAFSGQVVDAGSGLVVPDAFVEFSSGFYSYAVQADANGVFTIPSMFEDTYTITAGQWGWRTSCSNSSLIDDGTPPLEIELDAGWYDDFTFDFGWTESGDATEGLWERAEPVGQDIDIFELQTDVDIDTDCSDLCYLTGNGADLLEDDVQNGETILTSPIFDATVYDEPRVYWWFWYFNLAKGVTVDDSLKVFLRTGGEDHLIDVVSQSDLTISTWTQRSVRISDFVPPASDMQLVVSAAKPVDFGIHVLECALDGFEVVEDDVAVPEQLVAGGLALWPNPNDGTFTLQGRDLATAMIEVIDATGRRMSGPVRPSTGEWRAALGLSPGVYRVKVTWPNGAVGAVPLIVDRP